ncbi:MAG: hypothetical protein JOZ18_21380 [Chloroflexi bacterium]|nr:hypothetical protein [Chloroflexota bacterium]
MVGGTRGKVWMWSLLAACILTGIFYACTAIVPFAQRGGYFSFSLLEGSPTVTSSMIISEFTTNLSRLYSHLGWFSASQIGIAFLLYVLLGWWTARRTGAVTTGFLAGLWAGLFYGLIHFVISAVQFLLLLPTFSTSSHEGAAFRLQVYTTTIIFIDNISGFLFGFVLFGLLPGILGGIVGGLFGRHTKAPPGSIA